VAAVANSGARYFLRQVLEASLPGLFVLSHNEIPPGVKVISQGVIG
jgi:flagellar biosynthesis protein FlhA